MLGFAPIAAAPLGATALRSGTIQLGAAADAVVAVASALGGVVRNGTAIASANSLEGALLFRVARSGSACAAAQASTQASGGSVFGGAALSVAASVTIATGNHSVGAIAQAAAAAATAAQPNIIYLGSASDAAIAAATARGELLWEDQPDVAQGDWGEVEDDDGVWTEVPTADPWTDSDG